ncbi:3-deoxy-manno-octulosonate cytidylyltransferase [Sediminicola luteus]|uniref:3-deoxy-manno-octulosonate cytidylyltransferase n=1 Tax=Sediminicola luteus TaxID=319238 RepID=A0A2A4GB61_9FLAO|nr:3-deoxy-manno-octulosonate cytidylyltransferase [Sediminicola luteus]PCE64992.1 3-deoxy-D-manno-octulosonate cytidylyltransferase [Sediminicola luteus]
MKIIAMIPARYAASRFPGKLMKDLAGKPVIVRTYEAARDTGLFDEVIVVTDSQTIFNTITEAGGKAMMSQKAHECGSDRIAEAVSDMEVDIIINVQGDEPFTEKESLASLVKVFEQDKTEEIDLASLMTPITALEDINNPNNVKVIVDNKDFALYFSRAPIPYPRDINAGAKYFKHKGVYAFRKRALMDFQRLPMLALEATEKIEAIRYLEYGKKIKMVETHVTGIEIDTPDDLAKAKAVWK